MPVIAVFNQKGGVGKTTTCFNLAAALAREGKAPILIDLDPQAHLTLSCGLKNVPAAESIAAFFKDGKPLPGLMKTSPCGLRIVPSHAELSKIETFYGKDARIASRLKIGTQELLAGGTALLIDCCPTMGVLSLNALYAAERVLMPVSADFLSMQGVRRLDASLKVLETPLAKRFVRKVVV
ncbi:MAG: ParA family protein, partial [Burkholderiales bacterium]